LSSQTGISIWWEYLKQREFAAMTYSLMGMLFSFKSRLARAPFWWGCLGTWAAFAILFVFLEDSLGRQSTWILYPPFLWILTALMVKRLHDRGRGAASLLWLLLPVLGPLWLVFNLGFRRGTEGDNQFGPDTLLVNVDYLKVNTP
jgi:uncharacterized membrane protein YhaH (DUF805 family)